MCLKVDEKLTEEVRQRGKIEAYKLVCLMNGGLGSCFVLGHHYKPGENLGLGELNICEGNLHGGAIHVFLKREQAEKVADSENSIAISVVCEAANLVKAGYWMTADNQETAGYSKIWIEPTVYEEAVIKLQEMESEQEEEDEDDEDYENEYEDEDWDEEDMDGEDDRDFEEEEV